MRCHQARPEAPLRHPCLREVRHLQHPRSEQEGAGGSCDDTRVTTRTTPPICNSTRSARRSAGLVTAASGKFSGRSSGRLGACGALQQLGGSVLCTRAVDRSLTLCRRRRVHPAGVPQHRPVREQSDRSRPRAARVPSRPDGPQTRLQRSRGHATSHVRAEPPARPLRTREPHSQVPARRYRLYRTRPNHLNRHRQSGAGPTQRNRARRPGWLAAQLAETPARSSVA
jgi:hypothetical protein